MFHRVHRLLLALAALCALAAVSAGCAPFVQIVPTRPGEAYVLNTHDVFYCRATPPAGDQPGTQYPGPLDPRVECFRQAQQ